MHGPMKSESMLVVFINEPQSTSTADAPELATSVSDSSDQEDHGSDFSTFVADRYHRIDNPVPEADGDETRSTHLMFGRYLGQVSARIQRAWIRTRAARSRAARFACRVQIAQSMSRRRSGNVTLQQCQRGPAMAVLPSASN